MDLIILKSFLPEIFLSLCILVQLVFNAYLITDLKNNFPIIDKEILSQTFFILFCLLCLLVNSKIEGFFSNFLFLNDAGSRVVKILFVSICCSILLVLIRSFKLQKLNFFEYFSIFLMSVLSLLLLISSGDMITAYLVIEMQALSFYILASFRRNSAFSTESGLKYFISGAFISGIFLFGCSILYGIFGTLSFTNLSLLLAFPLNDNFKELYSFLFIGVLMITITFLFKLSVVPFHFWSPDVYEGSPLISTIIFSIIPKFAIIHFFIKWLSITLDFFDNFSNLLLFCGFFSFFVGAFFALRQKKLKRLIIYSSIAQIGFIISGLSVSTLDSLISTYFFIIIYILTSILVWTHFSIFYSFKERTDSFKKRLSTPLFVSSLSNLYKVNSMWSFSFQIIFFSIAGIPPLSGFLAKVFILSSIIESKNVFFSLLLAMISAVSVFYYLRVIKVIFFESKDLKLNNDQFQIVFNSPQFKSECLLISICLFLLLFFFFFPSFLLLICQYIVIGSFFF